MTHTAKHTPGPWVVDEVYEDEAGQETLGIYAEEGGYVAGIHCGPDATIDEQDKANATLLAAAPAMYEALKGMVSMYDSLNKSNKHDGACPCYHCQARAALAQAEGKP